MCGGRGWGGKERRNHSPWCEFKSQSLKVPQVPGPDASVCRGGEEEHHGEDSRGRGPHVTLPSYLCQGWTCPGLVRSRVTRPPNTTPTKPGLPDTSRMGEECHHRRPCCCRISSPSPSLAKKPSMKKMLGTEASCGRPCAEHPAKHQHEAAAHVALSGTATQLHPRGHG